MPSPDPFDIHTVAEPQQPEYALIWDGTVVTFPPYVRRGNSGHRDGFISEQHQAASLARELGLPTPAGAQVTVSLIPRPDNDYNQWAVSISSPPNGQPPQDRHMGFLYDEYLGRRGQQMLHRLSRYSDGEILCSAYIGGGGALNRLALPKPSKLLSAIGKFLESPSTPAVRTRPTLAELTGLEPYGKALTRDSLDHLSTFPMNARSVGQVTLSTRLNGRGRPRSLSIEDTLTGRRLGEVALGILFLEDERDRSAVLTRLAESGVPVAQPIDPQLTLSLKRSERWEIGKIPNMRTYWRVEGLDFRPHDPGQPRSRTWIAQYNPTTKILFVEDEPLVRPSLIYAARLGVEVSSVSLPKNRWQLEREFKHRQRRDLDLRPENYLDTTSKPKVRRILRHRLPDGIVGPDDLIWMDGVPSRDEIPPPPTEHFAMHEAAIRSRSALFPRTEYTGRTIECRLCGDPATEFTTPICEGALAYCQRCIENALRGVFGSFDQAAKALRFISELEHASTAPLEHQISSVQSGESPPFTPMTVDALIISRFAIRRRRWPWTRLLVHARLLDGGLRTPRGTIIEGQDGHLCLSMQEKAVDDFMYQHGIAHEREPLYPYDAELNPSSRRRADWLLADGTLVEMWGLPNNPAYAEKMREKKQLAERHGISLVGLTREDIPRLSAVFALWIAGDTALEARWASSIRLPRKKREAGDRLGRNPRNRQRRDQRVIRCREAVEHQKLGLSRKEIAEILGVAPETVKILLRDGKFYASPEIDSPRSEAAIAAAIAQELGKTKQQFRADHGLTPTRANEAWKDAAVLFAD